jgi:hypothetical protein
LGGVQEGAGGLDIRVAWSGFGLAANLCSRPVADIPPPARPSLTGANALSVIRALKRQRFGGGVAPDPDMPGIGTAMRKPTFGFAGLGGVTLHIGAPSIWTCTPPIRVQPEALILGAFAASHFVLVAHARAGSLEGSSTTNPMKPSVEVMPPVEPAEDAATNVPRSNANATQMAIGNLRKVDSPESSAGFRGRTHYGQPKAQMGNAWRFECRHEKTEPKRHGRQDKIRVTDAGRHHPSSRRRLSGVSCNGIESPPEHGFDLGGNGASDV